MHGVFREIARRSLLGDPLKTFFPTIKQAQFVSAVTSGKYAECYLLAANRCFTPWTSIETDRGERLAGELIGETGFYVKSWDGSSLCTKKASPLFLKGIESAFLLHLDNGEALHVSGNHLVYASVSLREPRRWMKVSQVIRAANVRRYSRTPLGWKANYGVGAHPHDGQPLSEVGSADARLPIEVCARSSGRWISHEDALAPKPEHSSASREHARLAIQDDSNLLADLFGMIVAQGRPQLALPSSLRDRIFSLFPCECDLLQVDAEVEVALDSQPYIGCSTILLASDFPLLFPGRRIVAIMETGLHPIMDMEVIDTHTYFSAGCLQHNSGKTIIGSFIGASYARQVRGFSDRPTAGWVVSLDYPMSRDVVQPYYFDNGFGVGQKPFIPGYEIRKFDKQAQTLFLKNGSQIAFKSVESGADKFQSAGKDWVHKDEVIPKIVDDEITIRVKAGSRLIQWATCTLLPPEGKTGNVHWLYLEVVKPWKSGDKRNWITNASIYDNPHLPRSEIERLEERYPEGSMSRRIRMDGELLPGITGTLVYSAFSHAIHVVQGLELDANYSVLWAWDFNVSPMCSLICQRRNNRIMVVMELWMEEGSIPEMCGMFRDIVGTQFPVWVYGDATGRSRSSHTRQTSYQIIANELVSRGYVVKMQVPEANPSVTDRINCMNAAMSDYEGKSGIAIDASCKELIADMESVVYDSNNGIRKISAASDPYRWRTHVTDALGYCIYREIPLKAWRPEGAGRVIRQIKYGS